MKKGVKLGIFLLIQILILSSTILATIEVGVNKSESLKLIYGESEILSGWINISISNEDSDLKLTDSFENKISLSDLILLNEKAGYLGSSNYYCNIKNCSKDYAVSEASSTKTFDLALGETKTIGLKVTGRELSVESVEFSLDSDAISSCTNQIQVDIGEGLTKISNYKVSETSCSDTLSYGCLDNSIQRITFNLKEENMYCQKIRLGGYPGFKLGAWIQKINGTDNVSMVLQNNLTSELASCKISNSDLSTSGSEVGCQIDYPISSLGDYFVCIKKTGNSGIIKIEGYTEGANNYCGYFTQGSYKELTQSYKIFAEAKKYDSLGSMKISNNLTSTPLNGIYNTYISKVYSNKNCSSGCILPIKITSNVNQKITLKDLSVKYTHSAGETDPATQFYEIEKSPSKISTKDFIKLYLDPVNFFVSDEPGNESLTIKLGDKTIYSGEIEIQNIPEIKYIYPSDTASAYPTEFQVNAQASSGNISSYLWKFSDDGLNKTTSSNKVIHTFNKTGNYSLYIEVKDTSGRIASETFEIIVGEPDEIISEKYSEIKNRLTNLQVTINSYPSFLGSQISNAINLETLSQDLEKYRKMNLSASTLEEENQVLTSLLNLSLIVPKSIKTSYEIKNLTYFPKESEINLEILKEISSGSYAEEDSSKYRQAILSWQEENLNVKLNYIQISAEFDSGSRSILNYFNIQMAQKTEAYPPYFILKTLEGLKFEGESGAYILSISNYNYQRLTNQQESIGFVTKEDLNFLNLPLFFAPELSLLDIQEEINPIEQQTEMKWGFFILIMIFILVLGIIGYIFLQEWYKNKYEVYLFKGKNNMYNLITYIEAQKKQGVSNSEIQDKLKNAGWNGEQISYVMKKYSGKRTGMIEIPIIGLFKKRENKSKSQNLNSNLNGNNPYGRRDMYSRR